MNTVNSFSDIKINSHVVIKDHVCKIVNIKTSKPGKHGSAKKVVTGLDVLTDDKYVETFKNNSLFPHFSLKTLEFQYLYTKNDGTMVLLDENGEENVDYTNSWEFPLQEEQLINILLVNLGDDDWKYKITPSDKQLIDKKDWHIK